MRLENGRTQLVVTGDGREVRSNARGWVLFGEPFTPNLPGLVLALGVLSEEEGVSIGHR